MRIHLALTQCTSPRRICISWPGNQSKQRNSCTNEKVYGPLRADCKEAQKDFSSQSSASKFEAHSVTIATNTKAGDTNTKWKESSSLTNVSKKQLTFTKLLLLCLSDSI